jgi:hypothetical protein
MDQLKEKIDSVGIEVEATKIQSLVSEICKKAKKTTAVQRSVFEIEHLKRVVSGCKNVSSLELIIKTFTSPSNKNFWYSVTSAVNTIFTENRELWQQSIEVFEPLWCKVIQTLLTAQEPDVLKNIMRINSKELVALSQRVFREEHPSTTGFKYKWEFEKNEGRRKKWIQFVVLGVIDMGTFIKVASADDVSVFMRDATETQCKCLLDSLSNSEMANSDVSRLKAILNHSKLSQVLTQMETLLEIEKPKSKRLREEKQQTSNKKMKK